MNVHVIILVLELQFCVHTEGANVHISGLSKYLASIHKYDSEKFFGQLQCKAIV